jgi:general secretion pathway protein D
VGVGEALLPPLPGTTPPGTTMRMLTGALAPDEGTVRLGTNLEPIYLDQRRASLDPERTLWATLTGGSGYQVMVRGMPRHVIGYLKDFLFDEGQALAPVGSLSGGAFGATSFSNTAPSLLTIAGAVAAREIGGTTTTVVGADGSRTTTSTPNPAADALAQQALNSVLGASGAFGGYGGTLGGDTVFGAIINAVKSDTTSNLLQAPSLITLDNQEARILVGQEIPITTGEALSQNFDNAFRTVQRENVGIQLEVRPQVNSSGSIKLFLHQQVSSIAGPVSNDNSDLILNKREVETTLTVDDGQIAIIGGLLSDDERRTLEKLPLLGDIPVLGNLFRSKGKQRTKTNLMVFIRPTILRTPEDNRRVTEQRYGYLRLQQGLHDPAREPSIDELVRDYMGAAAPIPSAPVPGNIEDPRIQVPVQRNSAVTIKRRDK